MAEITIHTDGASRGNPGLSAIAYVIEGLSGGKLEFSETIGSTTNNQAEYLALKLALSKVSQSELNGDKIICIADSELMIKQLNGEYRVKDPNLRPHFNAIIDMVTKIQKSSNTVSFLAVRRAENKRADELCNLALDGLL